MKHFILLTALIAGLGISSGYAASGEADEGPKPVVLIETSMGSIRVELEAQKAPLTVKNFLEYVESGFYDGTVFHRAVKNFVIQGGGYTQDLQKKATRPPIKNEAANGLRNRRGTIAMARPIEVDTATSQFFINLSNNPILDHKDDSIRGYGYAVFGRVIEGMPVADMISKVTTAKRKGMRYVPKSAVVIRSIRVVR